MITHLHVNSGEDRLKGIDVIGKTIFVKNILWLPYYLALIIDN